MSAGSRRSAASKIRARIAGFLEKVLFKEGDLIKEGSPLYRIERGLFEAQVRQAEGALERSQAAKALSALQLKVSTKAAPLPGCFG